MLKPPLDDQGPDQDWGGMYDSLLSLGVIGNKRIINSKVRESISKRHPQISLKTSTDEENKIIRP